MEWTVKKRVLLIFALLSSRSALAADRPAPVATLDLNSQWPGAVSTSLVFAAEDTIAIARYPGADTVSRFIITIDWRNSKLQPWKTKSLPIYGGGGAFKDLYAVSNGRILSSVAPNPQLWSRDLEKLEDTPIRVLTHPLPQSGMIGEWVGSNHWKLYRVGPPASLVREGAGEVLSVSSDLIAIRGDHDLRVENAQSGAVLGAFQIPPRSVCAQTVTILGKDRLLVTGCKGDARLLDLSGKEHALVPKRDGWGFRYGASADGSRFLFDDFTRRISTLQRISEFFESVATLGMGPNVQSTGEEIRVMDTRTGSICFDLDSPDHQFGEAGEHHADLSPSGRYVAVVDGNELRVYALPQACTIH